MVLEPFPCSLLLIIPKYGVDHLMTAFGCLFSRIYVQSWLIFFFFCDQHVQATLPVRAGQYLGARPYCKFYEKEQCVCKTSLVRAGFTIIGITFLVKKMSPEFSCSISVKTIVKAITWKFKAIVVNSVKQFLCKRDLVITSNKNHQINLTKNYPFSESMLLPNSAI